MATRRWIAIIASLVLVGGFAAFAFLPTSQAVNIKSTDPVPVDPEWEQCLQNPSSCLPPDEPTPPDDPILDPRDPRPCILSAAEVCPPLGDGTGIGTADVTITVHFTDGTQKVYTSGFKLLTVQVEGKVVSHINYDVKVTFSGLGDVIVMNRAYGLYLVPVTGAGYTIIAGGVTNPITVPDRQQVQIVGLEVRASQIDSFLVSSNLPDGDYVLRFYTSFSWVGQSVAFSTDVARGPASGVASIDGPDIPAYVSAPSGQDEICLDRRQVCVT